MKPTKTQRMRTDAVDGAMCELDKIFPQLLASHKAPIRAQLESLWDAGLQRGVEIADPDWERDLIG